MKPKLSNSDLGETSRIQPRFSRGASILDETGSFTNRLVTKPLPIPSSQELSSEEEEDKPISKFNIGSFKEELFELLSQDIMEADPEDKLEKLKLAAVLETLSVA